MAQLVDMSSHALQDPTAPVIQTFLDNTAASTAQLTDMSSHAL